MFLQKKLDGFRITFLFFFQIFNFEFKTSFILTNDIHHAVILGTPFINLITPYTVNYDSISFKVKGKKIIFPFIEKPKTRRL